MPDKDTSICLNLKEAEMGIGSHETKSRTRINLVVLALAMSAVITFSALSSAWALSEEQNAKIESAAEEVLPAGWMITTADEGTSGSLHVILQDTGITVPAYLVKSLEQAVHVEGLPPHPYWLLSFSSTEIPYHAPPPPPPEPPGTVWPVFYGKSDDLWLYYSTVTWPSNVSTWPTAVEDIASRLGILRCLPVGLVGKPVPMGQEGRPWLFRDLAGREYLLKSNGKLKELAGIPDVERKNFRLRGFIFPDLVSVPSWPGKFFEIATFSIDEEPYFNVHREVVCRLPAPDLSLLALSPDGTKILCLQDRNLWVINSDGTGARLLSIGNYVEQAMFSPDMGCVLSCEQQERSGAVHLRLFPLDSRLPGPVDLTEEDGAQISDRAVAGCWQPQPPYDLVFVRNPVGYNDRGDVWKTNLASHSKARLTTTGDVLACFWDPMGESILYTRRIPKENDASLWIMDSEGGNQRRLLHGVAEAPRRAGSLCVWSPEGEEFAATLRRGLWVVNADSGESQLVAQDAGGPVAWLREGRLVFALHEEDPFLGSETTLWTTAPDGSKRQRLALPYGTVAASPDGRRILYCYDDCLWWAEIQGKPDAIGTQ